MVLLLVAFAVTSLTGCAYIGDKTRLDTVAQGVQFKNITTGDGTFENYAAVGYYTGLEFGIAIGIPFWKWMELFPVQSNEDLLKQIAETAKSHGADAMINVTPHSESFWPIILPFVGIGIYFDRTSGTGIKTK
jgi:hypothetical protein